MTCPYPIRAAYSRINVDGRSFTFLAGQPKEIDQGCVLFVTTAPEPMTLPDFWGILRDGRVLAIECKRRGWHLIPSDDRALRQLRFLNLVRDVGGRAGFARSAEEARRIIEE